jgi:hypothetical protein
MASCTARGANMGAIATADDAGSRSARRITRRPHA